MMVRISAWFLFFMIMMAGCLDEPDCFRLNNYFVGISFKKLIDSSRDTALFNSITTEAPPLLFYDSGSVSQIALPLNYFEDETTFFFETPDTVQVLKLGYVSQAQFVSERCGERFVLSALRVLEHSFDSVRLVRDTPTQTNNGTIHLEIFQ